MMRRSETFALSGDECVAALCQLGFFIVRHHRGMTMLRARGRLVVVPDVFEVPTSLLDSILADAELSVGALIRALDEIPTNPELTTARE